MTTLLGLAILIPAITIILTIFWGIGKILERFSDKLWDLFYVNVDNANMFTTMLHGFTGSLLATAFIIVIVFMISIATDIGESILK